MAVFTGPEGIQEAVCTRIDPSIDEEEVSPISADDDNQSDNEQNDNESAAVANMPTRLWLGGIMFSLRRYSHLCEGLIITGKQSPLRSK